jgi:hypothetical protein
MSIKIERKSRELKVRTHRSVKTTHKLLLDDIDVIRLLKDCGVIPEQTKEITVKIHVPGGGDWSNEDLFLDNEPLIVEWTETEETES